MRLLRVIGSMNPASGGPCEGIRNSILELEKLNVLNEVVCLDAPDSSYLGGDSFPIHTLGPGKGTWCYSPKLLPWLVDHLNEFDVVIVHGLWLYHSYAVHQAYKRLERKYQYLQQLEARLPKVFIMPHGMLDPYFQTAPSRRLKAIRNSIYWKLIESRVVRQAAGVLFTCENELKLARIPFRPYKPKQEINVGYGIAAPPAYTLRMQKAFAEKCPQIQNQSYILSLGRIHEKKGVDLLVQAYAKVLDSRDTSTQIGSAADGISDTIKGSNILPKLIIAGPGLETSYGQYVWRLVAESRELRKMVLFPGMLVGDAKWGAYYGCDAFILPSHQENFGIAVVEALACAKPVLISDQVNIWHEIVSNGCGLVANDTLDGTLSLLNSWLKLPAKDKKAMEANTISTYVRHFAIKSQIMRLHKALSW